MKIVQRAVWFIESHLVEPIELADVASASGASRFHLSRSFAYVVGCTVSTYVRSRRLSEAAKLLAEGDRDILSVALAVGYGSHEAFTRAFLTQFGRLPTVVRAARNCAALDLMEPYLMPTNPTVVLEEPTYREEGPLLLAGIREFRTFEQRAGIPDQWRRFNEIADTIPEQTGKRGFGVCFAPSSGEEGFDYMAAVSVTSLNDMPEGLLGARLSKRHYAIFQHKDHVSIIGETCAAIFGVWQNSADVSFDAGPTSMIECYGQSFDPATGRGGFEIWIPVTEQKR